MLVISMYSQATKWNVAEPNNATLILYCVMCHALPYMGIAFKIFLLRVL